MTDTDRRCKDVEPVWGHRCVEDAGHEGVHRNDEVRGETLTWGTVQQVRAYERGEAR